MKVLVKNLGNIFLCNLFVFINQNVTQRKFNNKWNWIEFMDDQVTNWGSYENTYTHTHVLTHKWYHSGILYL